MHLDRLCKHIQSTLMAPFRILHPHFRGRRKVWVTCCLLAALVLGCVSFGRHLFSNPLRDSQVPEVWSIDSSAKFIDISKMMKSIVHRNQSSHSSVVGQRYKAESRFNDRDPRAASLCSAERDKNNLDPTVKATVIFSLHDVTSPLQALESLLNNFEYLDDNLIDDVIITTDKIQPSFIVEHLEGLVDLCDVCRLFFVDGNVYEQRNFASNFARNDYLVFVDWRVELTTNWLRPLLACSREYSRRVVSPQLRLRHHGGNAHTVGLVRNEITWDLSTVRANVDPTALDKAVLLNHTFLHQTSVTKELIVVRKTFFAELKKFDASDKISGLEDTMFSLKVLNCDGQVVTSLCSTVYFPVHDQNFRIDQVADFFNPSFHVSRNSPSFYFYTETASKIWLDPFSLRYYNCVSGRKVNVTGSSPQVPKVPSSWHIHRSRFEKSITSYLTHSKCQYKNMRYVNLRFQPRLLTPSKSAQFYGYIRSLDGLSALGLKPYDTELSDVAYMLANPPGDLSAFPASVVLTRNVSSWIGPFSYTNGAFIFHHSWCLTLTEANLFTITKCTHGSKHQLFSYKNNFIQPQDGTDRCACAKITSAVYNHLYMTNCAEKNVEQQFKFDVVFYKACIN